MTPNEFIIEMQKCADCSDQEKAHERGDELMIEVLKEQGFTKGAEIFENMSKWYS